MPTLVPHQDLADAAVTFHQWHGGQGTALYALVSSVYAGRDVPLHLVDRAVSEAHRELRYIHKVHGRGFSRHDVHALAKATAEAEEAANAAREGRRPNPGSWPSEHPWMTFILAWVGIGAFVSIFSSPKA